MRRSLSKLILWYLQHSRPHAGRGMLGKLAHRLHPAEVVIESTNGLRIKVNLSHTNDIVHWIDGSGDCEETTLFLSQVKEGMTVVDIGANAGLFAMLAARAVGPRGRVLAFEPVPAVFRRLTEHLELNSITNVSPYQLALSDVVGTARFFLGRNDMTGSLFRKQTPEAIEIETDTLDHVLEAANVRRVDMVKVDAEGAEMHILRGMHGLLSQPAKPLLWFELNPTALAAASSSAEALFEAICGFGYAAYLVHPGGKLMPLTRVVAPLRKGEEPYSNCLFTPR